MIRAVLWVIKSQSLRSKSVSSKFEPNSSRVRTRQKKYNVLAVSSCWLHLSQTKLSWRTSCGIREPKSKFLLGWFCTSSWAHHFIWSPICWSNRTFTWPRNEEDNESAFGRTQGCLPGRTSGYILYKENQEDLHLRTKIRNSNLQKSFKSSQTKQYPLNESKNIWKIKAYTLLASN